MKSSRLLSIVLLLQTRERMTTAALAERLEVSRRTILRDVDALSAAGVPVRAQRGRHGAIVLDRRARLDLARLDPEELQLLAAAGLSTAKLDQIGLGAASEQIRGKIDAAASRTPTTGSPIEDVLLVDPAGWFERAADLDLAGLLGCIRDGRRIELRYRRSGEAIAASLEVDPYGLAAKAGGWYLVADVDGAPRMFAGTRIESWRGTDEPAQLRSGRTLRAVWTELLDRFDREAAVEVRAELRADRLDLAQRILGSRLIRVEHRQADRVAITVAYPDVESVRQLLQFGDHIRVVAPPEATRRIRELAQDLVDAHHP